MVIRGCVSRERCWGHKERKQDLDYSCSEKFTANRELERVITLFTQHA